MALATQCPHCQTTFRVVHDQLKLRAGLVRCGHCKEIFNGIEHLLPPPDLDAGVKTAASVAPALVQPPTSTVVAEHVEREPFAAPQNVNPTSELNSVQGEIEAGPDHSPSHQIAFETPAAPEVEVTTNSELQQPEPEASEREDPLLRMTLVDFTREYPEDKASKEQELNGAEAHSIFDPNSKDELDEAIEDLQRKPWRKKSSKAQHIQDEVDALDDDEPTFVKRGRRQQRVSKNLRIVLSFGCLILLITALLQGTYLFRNQIAGIFPETKPWLTQLCDAISCDIELPEQITAVSIESSELQALAENKNTFVLTTLLRNSSNTLQAWPHIELSLNDTNEKPLLRRVFKPSDYLSANEVRAGFSASSEHSVKLSFELSQIKASGYRVYLFYP